MLLSASNSRAHFPQMPNLALLDSNALFRGNTMSTECIGVHEYFIFVKVKVSLRVKTCVKSVMKNIPDSPLF